MLDSSCDPSGAEAPDEAVQLLSKKVKMPAMKKSALGARTVICLPTEAT